MFLQKRKRVKLTLEEKLWILSHKKENRESSNAKVALDFSVKFKRPISKNCVQNILSQKESIQSILKAAPDLDAKKTISLRSATRFEFETELEAVLESKYRMMNITYEIIQLAGQELQKAAKYQGIEEVESLKFSDNWITAFSRRNKIRKIDKIIQVRQNNRDHFS